MTIVAVYLSPYSTEGLNALCGSLAHPQFRYKSDVRAFAHFTGCPVNLLSSCSDNHYCAYKSEVHDFSLVANCVPVQLSNTRFWWRDTVAILGRMPVGTVHLRQQRNAGVNLRARQSL